VTILVPGPTDTKIALSLESWRRWLYTPSISAEIPAARA
jgi:hypothetical protein